MSQIEDLWERLVRAALRRESIAGNVPSSLENNRDTDAILRTADEIQDEELQCDVVLRPPSRDGLSGLT
ncbi:hypothetical protein Q3G72_022885 [Acer saccharum]|nr:hypothetical protein Q3G72_022885 [Acer saccharum]